MAIPGHAVVTGVSGASYRSARTAAGSWPHPGLVDLFNVINTTPPGGAPYRGWFLLSGAQWTSSVNCINPVTCALNGLVRNTLSLNGTRRHSRGAPATR
jgi:hypothetical protein